MIALCVNLARRTGLRAVPDVLALVCEWLGVEVALPVWTTVRTWTDENTGIWRDWEESGVVKVLRNFV